MDEPFGAIDPITRARLQEEFLRLQREVRKTIVFVTHDIEEAVRLGDRIAVMSYGGHVEQFATPAELLGKPANEFVADFVGSDRGLKRLAVTGIDTADLERPPVVHVADGLADARAAMTRAGAHWAVVLDRDRRLRGYLARARASGDGVVSDRIQRLEAWVRDDDTLKDALSMLLDADVQAGLVVDRTGALRGMITVDDITALMRERDARPLDATERAAADAEDATDSPTSADAGGRTSGPDASDAA
jgi:osmoprotectant transport system ATP-binding protein